MNNTEGAVEAFLYFGPAPFAAIDVRKVLQILHDLTHALETFLRLIEQGRNITYQKGEIDLLLDGSNGSDRLARRKLCFKRGICVYQRKQTLDIIIQCGKICIDIT